MLRKKLCLALLWRRVRVTACVRANFLAAGAAGGAYRARRSALLAMLFTRASNNHLSRIGCGPGLSGGRPTAGPRRGIGGYNVLDRRVGLGPVRGRFGFRWLNRTHDPAELTVSVDVWWCVDVTKRKVWWCVQRGLWRKFSPTEPATATDRRRLVALDFDNGPRVHGAAHQGNSARIIERLGQGACVGLWGTTLWAAAQREHFV